MEVKQLKGSKQRSVINYMQSHQNILKLDVPMKESLGMQEANPLHHIQSYLHPSTKVKANLQCCMQVTRIPERKKREREQRRKVLTEIRKEGAIGKTKEDERAGGEEHN